MKDDLSVKAEKDERESFLFGSKGRKHPHGEEVDVEENRSSKQAAIYSEPMLRS
ncbi:scarecrow-like protein 9-like, partial [Trifolium medium]|nr:scarecrow-like protein 9-like [Trifolium medium]